MKKTAAAAADEMMMMMEKREREGHRRPRERLFGRGAQAAADTDDYRKLYAILPPPRESAHSHRVPLAFVRLSAVDLPRRWPLPSQALCVSRANITRRRFGRASERIPFLLEPRARLYV
jgi:hypothetical protein